MRRRDLEHRMEQWDLASKGDASSRIILNDIPGVFIVKDEWALIPLNELAARVDFVGSTLQIDGVRQD